MVDDLSDLIARFTRLPQRDRAAVLANLDDSERERLNALLANVQQGQSQLRSARLEHLRLHSPAVASRISECLEPDTAVASMVTDKAAAAIKRWVDVRKQLADQISEDVTQNSPPTLLDAIRTFFQRAARI